MKTGIFVSGAIVLIFLSACSIEEGGLFPNNSFAKEIVFTAVSGEAHTKTAFQADETSIWWSPGDAIAIYYGASASSMFTATNNEEVAQAEFRGKLKAFTGVTEEGSFNYFWAVYPYSAAENCDGQSVIATLSDEQVAKAGSFAPNTNVTIARSTGLALSFYNTCSWFRFSVMKEGVKRVIFRGNNNEDIAGSFRISMGEDNLPTPPAIIEGKKEITLSLPENASFEVGKLYYITLLPQVFQNGFSVTFKTDSEIGSRTINAKATYLRSKYNTGVDFDKAIEYAKNPVPAVGEIIDSDGFGVVCWVSEDEKQVLLMSVTELQKQDWSTSNNWCISYGQSWRMPTIEELTKIHSNFDAVNSGLSNAGYAQLTTGNYCYWSSTVNPNNSNYYYRERLYDGLVLTNCGSDEKATSKANYTRAVKQLDW